jgi:hypothetical protein
MFSVDDVVVVVKNNYGKDYDFMIGKIGTISSIDEEQINVYFDYIDLYCSDWICDPDEIMKV